MPKSGPWRRSTDNYIRKPIVLTMQASELSGVPRAAERALTRSDYKTLGLAALGGALEFYDFIIFVFFAPAIGQLFFPHDIPDWLRQLQTFGIFAAGYLARPLGGVIMAHFGDLFGRKRMFTLSVLMMSVPTLLMGLLPTYDTIGILAPVLLLLFRVLQGAAVGGEVPGAWVFVSEHVPSRHIGYACGTLTADSRPASCSARWLPPASTAVTRAPKSPHSRGAFRSCSAACSACSPCTCAAGCMKRRCSRR